MGAFAASCCRLRACLNHTRQLGSKRDQNDVEQDVSDASSEDFKVGLTLAAGGLAMSFLWQAMLNFVVLGGSEEVYDACVSAVHGRVENINRSAFPTQIWCEAEGNAHAGAVYSAWQSVGFSAVTVILVVVVLCGGWMMVRRGKSAGS